MGESETAPVLRFAVIQGSARTDGQTAEVARYLQDIFRTGGCAAEVITLADYRIDSCRCGRCNERTSPCEVEDDTRALVERMVAADGVVFGAPVHGFGLATTMQTFLERAGVGVLRFQRPLADRVGGAFVVGRRYNHSAVMDQLYANLLLNRMVIPGSGFRPQLSSQDGQSALADMEGVASLESMANRMMSMAGLLRGPRVEMNLGHSHPNERQTLWAIRNRAPAGIGVHEPGDPDYANATPVFPKGHK